VWKAVNPPCFLDFDPSGLYVDESCFSPRDGVPFMAGLADVVRGLAARDGVDAVVVVSGDGLPIDHASRGPCDADALAALAVTLLRPATRLGETAQRGALTRAVFEYDGGLAIIAQLGEGNALLLLASPGTDVGPMLYDLRRNTPALRALL
jgi:predicted regulator of Ras-like GTPase activity (Roadblock/LC7/MglB family)